MYSVDRRKALEEFKSLPLLPPIPEREWRNLDNVPGESEHRYGKVHYTFCREWTDLDQSRFVLKMVGPVTGQNEVGDVFKEILGKPERFLQGNGLNVTSVYWPSSALDKTPRAQRRKTK